LSFSEEFIAIFYDLRRGMAVNKDDKGVERCIGRS
jgi:hypothetical protein